MLLKHQAVCLGTFFAALHLACAALLAQEPDKPQQTQILPITAAFCETMKQHHVMGGDAPVSCDRLRLIEFSYYDFENTERNDGQIVVMDAVSDNVARIFDALFSIHFRLHKAITMDHFDGNDEASMAENNTSGFNVRNVAGTKSLSTHSFGLAIDVNPVQNPYLRPRLGYLVSPPEGRNYLNREQQRYGMTEPIARIFACHGFPVWGGSWRDPIDYQHFQVRPELVPLLAKASTAAAREMFVAEVARYSACCANGGTAQDHGPSQSCLVDLVSSPSQTGPDSGGGQTRR